MLLQDIGKCDLILSIEPRDYCITQTVHGKRLRLSFGGRKQKSSYQKGGGMQTSVSHLRPRRVDRAAYARTVALALRRDLACSTSATKEIMRWTGASERSVKNWLSGRNGPSGAHLIELMGPSTSVFEAIKELAGRETTTDARLTAKAYLELALQALAAESKQA
jgi:hypothetical protein